MAANEPIGDNARKGAVRQRTPSQKFKGVRQRAMA
jgi:hypothetical protein